MLSFACVDDKYNGVNATDKAFLLYMVKCVLNNGFTACLAILSVKWNEKAFIVKLSWAPS